MRRLLSISMIMLAGASLSQGCAAPARAGAMVPALAPAPASAPAPFHVAVASVEGGSPTTALGRSAVGGGELAEALRATLAGDGLLAGDSVSADYLLHTTIRKLDRPWTPFTTTVTTSIEYVLVGRLDGRRHSITLETQGKAGMSDAFFGVHRMRIANEAAMRANIACLAQHLRALDASVGFSAATNAVEGSDCTVNSR